MSPADVAKLFQDALDIQPTIIGQLNDDNLLALKEKLHDILQTISYDRADGFHHAVGVMQTESAYMADHNGIACPIPRRPGLWDDKIAKDATVVEMKKGQSHPQSLLQRLQTLEDSQRWLQEAHPCCSGGDVFQRTQGWHHFLPQGPCA